MGGAYPSSTARGPTASRGKPGRSEGEIEGLSPTFLQQMVSNIRLPMLSPANESDYFGAASSGEEAIVLWVPDGPDVTEGCLWKTCSVEDAYSLVSSESVEFLRVPTGKDLIDECDLGRRRYERHYY